MQEKIVVIGATGNLGERIVQALTQSGAQVRALTRKGAAKEKTDALHQHGAEVVQADMMHREELTKALRGATVVVSALQGLHDVIVDMQTVILDAAIDAGVTRFIPSDFSTDYTRVAEGENRNFDLRRIFYTRLNESPIQATSIFNGAFSYLLAYNTPMFDIRNKSIGYWESPDQVIEFTTMDDTAAFTAATAMDPLAPRNLYIASFQVTPRELQAAGQEVFGFPVELKFMGSVADFAAYNKKLRAEHREGEKELYPKWQSSQYMQSMFTVHNEKLDNDRYPVKWTSLKEVLEQINSKKTL